MGASEPITRVKRELNGLMLLDKPEGISSNQALQRVKWLLRAKKAGHTGTLDPLATGLLPICLGEATKFSRFQLEADKRYRVKAQFGAVSDTGDREGEITSTGVPPLLDLQSVEGGLSGFRGVIDQRPPVYSAIKKDGRRLCDYARAGIEVKPETRRVNVSQFELIELRGDQATFEISCSKGTYVRSLVVDLGEALGFGAYVLELRRLSCGGLGIDDAISLTELEQVVDDDNRMVRYLRPTEMLLEGLEPINVSLKQAARLKLGQSVELMATKDARLVALSTDGRFFGVGEQEIDGVVRPKRLLRH
ncbi:MAG: tRNA pseudouridine(55) synthase TruB [Immundisolibacteraceae bacterium]|nr:tRNA pseudouridine(55) synthase TruB [Immundisolibacteraceae bacterium]